MEDFYSHLRGIERIEHLTIPSKNYDIVLDVSPDEQHRIFWSYYYACHDTRCLFWLDEYDATFLTSELDGVESPAHLSASQAFTIRALFLLIRRIRASFGGSLLVRGPSFTELVPCALILS